MLRLGLSYLGLNLIPDLKMKGLTTFCWSEVDTTSSPWYSSGADIDGLFPVPPPLDPEGSLWKIAHATFIEIVFATLHACIKWTISVSKLMKKIHAKDKTNIR